MELQSAVIAVSWGSTAALYIVAGIRGGKISITAMYRSASSPNIRSLPVFTLFDVFNIDTNDSLPC